MSRAADIAAGLTEAQRQALCAICDLGNDPYGREAWMFAKSGAAPAALRRKGLLIGGRIYGSRTTSYRFTELGMEVRRHLQQERGEG